jgi:hypothetical protein
MSYEREANPASPFSALGDMPLRHEFAGIGGHSPSDYAPNAARLLLFMRRGEEFYKRLLQE